MIVTKILMVFATAMLSVRGYTQVSYSDSCPEVLSPAKPIEESDFPGSSVTKFSRSQDTIPNCVPTEYVEFLTYWAKRMNVWKAGPLYSEGGSASDLQLQLVKRIKLQLEEGAKLQPGRVIKSFSSVEDFYNYSELGVERNARDIFSIANEVGICPEKKFPSEFLPKGTGMIEAYAAFQKAYNKLQETEAGVLGLFTCPECLKLAPSYDINGVPFSPAIQNIKDLASNLSFPKNSFEAIDLLNRRACTPDVRVKLPPLKFRSDSGYPSVYGQIREGNPVLVGLSPKAVLSDVAYERESNKIHGRPIPKHAAIVVGAYKNKKYDNQCYIVIKSSWFDDCVQDLPMRICLKSGAMAIRKDLFEATVKDNVWVDAGVGL